MKRLRWIPILVALAAGANALDEIEPAPAPAAPAAPDEINLFGDEFPPIANRARVGRGVLTVNGKEVPKAEPEQTLQFHNGRQLRGELVAITRDEVVWRRKDASEPLRISRADVRRVVLVPIEQLPTAFNMGASSSSGDAVPQATVKLPGGDWLRGTLTSPDGEKFSLALKGGTPIEVPRAQIEWMSIGTKPAPAAGLGLGAMALDGWLTAGTPTVESKDGTLFIRDTQWIGRHLATPSRFEIAFEVPEKAEEGLQLWIQPFNPQPNCYSTGTVHVRFAKKSYHWVVYHETTQTKEEPLPAEAQAEKGPVSFRVLYDTPGQRVVVLRNGRKIGDWSLKPKVEQAGMDSQQRLPRGFCLNQLERGNKSALQIRRLSLLPWDGAVPESNAAAAKEDRLSHKDAPAVDGRLEAVNEKELVFAGKTISFDATSKTDTFVKFPQLPAPLTDGDAMVSFGQQGELSMTELQVSEGKVSGRSVFAPSLELPSKALQFIAFAPQKGASGGAGDLLVFKNGDELPGALVAAATGAPLRWRLASGQEIEFQAGRIAGVRLTSAAKVAPAGTIELRTGERLRGTVAAFDNQQLRWTHSTLGELAVDRPQLWRLYPNPRQSLRDGSQNPEHWLRDSPTFKRFIYYSQSRPREGAWLALDGRFILRKRDGGNGEQTQGPICELGPGLDRYELRVDIGYPGQNPGTLMVTLSNGEEGGVVLNVSAYEINLYVQNPKSRMGGANRELPLRDKIDQDARQLNLRAFVNRTAGTVDLMVNGHFLGRTGQTASDRLPGVGKNIGIDTYIYGRSELVLSQVTIVPWSGEVPRFGESAPVTILANGDAAPGVPMSLTENHWKLESEIGALELPVDKVQAVEFGGEMQPIAAVGRIRLVDGSALLVDRFQWGGGSVTAHHALFGDLRLPAGEVSELIYNPVPAHAPAVQDPTKTAKQQPAKAPVILR